jgi:hypothetical protein
MNEFKNDLINPRGFKVVGIILIGIILGMIFWMFG